MGDYEGGWAAAHGNTIDALDRVLEEALVPGDCEPLLRNELERLVEEAEGETDLEGKALAGLQDGVRIHRKRVLEILSGEGDWGTKLERMHEALDELEIPWKDKIREDLGLE